MRLSHILKSDNCIYAGLPLVYKIFPQSKKENENIALCCAVQIVLKSCRFCFFIPQDRPSLGCTRKRTLCTGARTEQRMDEMCCYDEAPEFEIRIKGHSLVTFNGAGVRVDGRDFHADIRDLSAVAEVIGDILESASEAKKPRLIAGRPVLAVAGGIIALRQAANSPT